jgi:predicted TIM-barrel fold metal-dependent hydrolase
MTVIEIADDFVSTADPRVPRIVSPDDHVQCPPHVWQDRVPAKLKAKAPRIERLRGTAIIGAGNFGFTDDPNGYVADVWHFDGLRVPLMRLAAAAGVERSSVDGRPVTYEDIRTSCYDPVARLADMDMAGVEASVCYPNMFVRFAGQTFSLSSDKEVALACIRAYNDYLVEEWCAGSGGRLVPIGIVPLWDVDLAVAEVERIAALGFRGITFSEIPHLLGLPSVHSGYWEPLFAACERNEQVLNLHIGTGGFPMLAADAPGAVPNIVASLNSAYAMTDYIMSGVFHRYPGLKAVFAESQLGWIPYVLQRADFVWRELRGEGFSDMDDSSLPEPPSYYFKNNVFCTFFRDPVGLSMVDRIGVDNILYEVDFPHTDSSWPDSRAVAGEMTAMLTDEQVSKIVAENSRKLFRIQVES